MSGEVGEKELAFVQLALNTADMVGSLRLYSELFGFDNAGCGAAWGKNLAIQDVGSDAHCLMWWMIGDQPFFQLEFFNHGKPKQKPQPTDWRPCDHGWVRFGVAASDFDRVVSGLERMSIPMLGTSGAKPDRRLAFRDPDIGAIVEVLETSGRGPTIVYATSSVGDLEAARNFYRDVVGADIQPLDRLHSPADEALWGLANAERDGFLVDLPGGYLEIVHYSNPKGKARRADHQTSDQGIMNVGIGTRAKPLIQDLIRRVQDNGRRITMIFETGELCATYMTESGYELELLSVPHELNAFLGYEKEKDRVFLVEFAQD